MHMHAERDILLPIKSVCPMRVNEWTYYHVFYIQVRGVILVILVPSLLQFQVEPLTGGVKYMWVGKYCKYCHL